MRGQVFFACGHSNWGKSMTLRGLTGGHHQGRWTKIGGVDLWVKKMSNDDRPERYFKVMGALDPVQFRHVVAALCPRFDESEFDPSNLLAKMQSSGYQLHFWVMKHAYHGGRSISGAEISKLTGFGSVRVFSRRGEAAQRCSKFRAFIAAFAHA